jgi:hypothetical protein
LLKSAGYDVILQQLSTQVWYGCGVAIKKRPGRSIVASGFTPYQESLMGRGIVWALVQEDEDDHHEVLFTTTHLESFVGEQMNDTVLRNRALQMRELKAFCEKCLQSRPTTTKLAIITGDLNWDDVRPRSKGPDPNLQELLGPKWTDCWMQLHPFLQMMTRTTRDPGYTYDTRNNAMLGGSSNGIRRRFDRCLVYNGSGNNNDKVVKDMKLIGTEPIPGLVWNKPPSPTTLRYNPHAQPKNVPVYPSDHFGLLVQVKY